MKTQRPHKWRNNRHRLRSLQDATHCVECEKGFIDGDLVFTDVAVTIHAACLDAYSRTLKKLGLHP